MYRFHLIHTPTSSTPSSSLPLSSTHSTLALTFERPLAYAGDPIGQRDGGYTGTTCKRVITGIHQTTHHRRLQTFSLMFLSAILTNRIFHKYHPCIIHQYHTTPITDHSLSNSHLIHTFILPPTLALNQFHLCTHLRTPNRLCW